MLVYHLHLFDYLTKKTRKNLQNSLESIIKDIFEIKEYKTFLWKYHKLIIAIGFQFIKRKALRRAIYELLLLRFFKKRRNQNSNF